MDGKGDSKLCLWLKLPYAALHKLALPGPYEDVRDADNRERCFVLHSATKQVPYNATWEAMRQGYPESDS